jgi:Asp-tRNA(Asn)/Glu-tRNA(Gln) amidotransferase A subunit family amidase
MSREELPIGMQFIGRHFDEKNLLSMGYLLEKEYGGSFGIVPEHKIHKDTGK